MTIRLTLGRLRRMLAEAMTDDQARRKHLRDNPPSMEVEEAIDEFVSMLGPEIVVNQQDVISVSLTMPSMKASNGAKQALEDEVSYTLVNELGYTYEEDGDYMYRRGNTAATITGGTIDNRRDAYTLEVEFIDDSPGSAPVEITMATAAKISRQAIDAFIAKYDEDERENKVFWTVSSPNDTNEVELRPWLKRVWEKMAVEHGGQSVVLFCGDSVDDEYGEMWDESLGEWHDYAF